LVFIYFDISSENLTIVCLLVLKVCFFITETTITLNYVCNVEIMLNLKTQGLT
jgi:hypothetical protein